MTTTACQQVATVTVEVQQELTELHAKTYCLSAEYLRYADEQL